MAEVFFKFLVNTPACLIGMEASCGCHHLGRTLAGFGHDVRLIPAQFVKPFVKSQKNDYRDAEAVQRPTMRFVPIKTEEQLDIQAVHRIRERLRSVCLHVNRARHAWGEWISDLKSRKPSNVATVALANKLARIAWSVLDRNEVYLNDASSTAVLA